MEPQTTLPIRVFLIVEQNILLWGLQELIKNHGPNMQFVGSSTNFKDVIPASVAASPDVILLDLDMQDEHALKISDLVSATHSSILLITRRDDQQAQDNAIFDGGRGILDKHATPEVYVEAITKVHQGQLWLDRLATGRVFVALSQKENNKLADEKHSKISTLTEREKRIVASIFENSGDSAKAIAEKLYISESTLRNHLTSIYGKLGISNRFELISYALKNNHSLTTL